MNQCPGDARGAIGRTASARAREGSVPETNRETGPTARAIVCREMDGMRTVVVPRGHPAAWERAPFVQSRRPQNPPGDSRRRTARNLPRDATGPGRLVEETRGTRQVEKGSRQGNRGRRDDLGARLRERENRRANSLYTRQSQPGRACGRAQVVSLRLVAIPTQARSKWRHLSNCMIRTEASVAVLEVLRLDLLAESKILPSREVPRYLSVWLSHRGRNDSQT